jgi:predicted dehydrogenase
MHKGVIKIGILGCSDIAMRKFIPAVKKCRYAGLGGVASRSKRKAGCWAKDLNLKPYSYNGILEAPDIDMVYISLPNSMHEEWSVKAFENGKHVLCEKPLSLDIKSARKIIRSARSHNRYLFEGLMHLHHPQHLKVKDLLKSGKIGKPVMFRSSFGFNLDNPENFRLKKELGGGAFLDLMGYPLSCMRFLFDCEPAKVSGLLKRDDRDVDVSGIVSVAMKNSVLGQISFGFNQTYECFYHILGTKGSIFLDRCYTAPDNMENVIHVRIGNNEKTVRICKADHFALMVDNFCRKIINSEPAERTYLEIERHAAAMEFIKKGLIEIGCHERRDSL